MGDGYSYPALGECMALIRGSSAGLRFPDPPLALRALIGTECSRTLMYKLRPF